MAQGRLRFTESGCTPRSMASTDRSSKFRTQLSSSYDYDCLFKLLICGDSGVGKTSVLLRFVSNKFRVANICTKGVDFMMKHTVVQEKKVQLQIWDTAGQEEFNSITEQYFRRAEGILLVYDITNAKSFDNLNKWMEKLRQILDAKVPIVLLGNKVDLADQRQIDKERGVLFAEKEEKFNMQFFETSCQSSVNITEAIHQLVEMMLEVKPIPEPESIPENKSGPNSTVTAPENENISLPEKPKDIEEKKAEDGRSWCSC